MDEYIEEAEPAAEDEFDENDEDHAEETAVHDFFADEADSIEEIDEDEVEDPSLTETIPDEAAFEEFGGDEHKAIGDRASGNAQTDIMYGSPPRPLSFGDVVALAGDYFGSYSECRPRSDAQGTYPTRLGTLEMPRPGRPRRAACRRETTEGYAGSLLPAGEPEYIPLLCWRHGP